MTDLTEQWRKGELPLGWYYVKYKNDKIEPAENIKWFDCGGWCDNRFPHKYNISGVIAPVPSYEEYAMTQDCVKRLFEAAEKETILKKQLTIAVEALEYIYDDTKKGHTQCDACGYCSSCETCINAEWAEKALNQIKELENE